MLANWSVGEASCDRGAENSKSVTMPSQNARRKKNPMGNNEIIAPRPSMSVGPEPMNLTPSVDGNAFIR